MPCHALQELSSITNDGISLRSPVPDILKPLIPAQVCLYPLPVINGGAQANLLFDLSCKDVSTFCEASVINGNTALAGVGQLHDVHIVSLVVDLAVGACRVKLVQKNAAY